MDRTANRKPQAMTLLKLPYLLREVLCQAPAYLFYFLAWWLYPQRTLRHKAAATPHEGVRQLLLRRSGVAIGRQVAVSYGDLFLGRTGTGPAITIGDRVALGPCVIILAASSPDDSRLAALPEVQPMIHRPGPVVVQEDAWIGAGAIILPGLTIGRGAIVGAGAVVTHDVAPYTVVAGVPARVLRTLRHDADTAAPPPQRPDGAGGRAPPTGSP